MIQTQNLEFSYRDGKKFRFPDIHCAEKEQLLILGQSGVGKSTLLHLLGGLMRPSSGSVIIGGEHIEGLSDKEMDRFRGDHIGIVFQKNHFVASLSVIENLTLAQYLAGQKENKKACQELLDRLNIGALANRNISRLSQGEQQRVAIARALVNEPRIILADEPTSALDDLNCAQVVQLLEEQAEYAGAALVIVTHDARLKEHVSHHTILEA